MAIKPPAWAKDAVPTARGWTHPRTGEVLKAQKFSEQQINEYNGVSVEKVEQPAQPEMLVEAPASDKSLEEMTKLELEALGRQHGIELDRRQSKSDLIVELEDHIGEWDEEDEE